MVLAELGAEVVELVKEAAADAAGAWEELVGGALGGVRVMVRGNTDYCDENLS